MDQSLTGAKPADIPVERPIKLELLINLKSAKILGPKIPEKLLALAGEASNSGSAPSLPCRP